MLGRWAGTAIQAPRGRSSVRRERVCGQRRDRLGWTAAASGRGRNKARRSGRGLAREPDPQDDGAAPDPLADWLTTAEVAALTGIDKTSVRRYVWRGALPAPVRKGNFLLWRRAEIETWLADRRPTGRPKKA